MADSSQYVQASSMVLPQVHRIVMRVTCSPSRSSVIFGSPGTAEPAQHASGAPFRGRKTGVGLGVAAGSAAGLAGAGAVGVVGVLTGARGAVPGCVEDGKVGRAIDKGVKLLLFIVCWQSCCSRW
jgi:hypothetical protein